MNEIIIENRKNEQTIFEENLKKIVHEIARKYGLEKIEEDTLFCIAEIYYLDPNTISRSSWIWMRREGLVNGIGPSGAWYSYILNKIMGDEWEASADIHDLGYLLGGTEQDRERIDYGFISRLSRDVAKEKGFFNRFLKFGIVAFFAFFVRFFGKKYFNFNTLGNKNKFK